jgi:UDP-galactopyranose mutase
MKIIVVGAGFAGAVLARELAEAGHTITVIDKRDHIGGNAFDFVNWNGERIHQYGPHLFHGSEDSVAVKWLSKFTEWTPYEHRVRASLTRFPFGDVPLPVNADTLEAVFSKKFESEEEAQVLLHSMQEEILKPENSDEVFLKSVGKELADIFFRPYTRKMWGKDAKEIEAAVGARIPVRYNRDDRYFTDSFQAMPTNGYVAAFERIFDHKNITVETGVEYAVGMEASYDHMFTAMPIDAFFSYKYGKLPYRSIKFNVDKVWRDQSATTINFTDDGPYTRRTQWDLIPNSEKSRQPYHTVTYETPCDPEENGGECYYPVRNQESLELYRKYVDEAETLGNVTFCGRTGLFQYLDMVPAITIHLKMASDFLCANQETVTST